MNRRSLRCAVAACLVSTLVLAGAARGDDLVKLTPEQRRAAAIETAGIGAALAAPGIGLPARVEIPSPQLRVVAAPLAGLVESVSVATLSNVKRGQALARLVSPGLADLQHTWLQAASQLQLAESALKRDEQLHREGIIALARLEAARSRQQELSAQLAERTQALKAAGSGDESLKRLREGRGIGTGITLAAPIDGMVLEQMAVPGQRVEAAAPLFRIATLSPLWLEIQLPADRAQEVAVGGAVRVPAAEVVARIVAVGRTVAPGTQTIALRAEVRAGAERLRPGQLVEALVDAPPRNGVWQVPVEALARAGGRVFVYVERPDGCFAQPVQVQEESQGRARVAAPFKGGERIAVKGVAALKAVQSGIGGAQSGLAGAQ